MTQASTGAELRQEIDCSIASGAAPAAYFRLRELWSREPNVASAAFVVSRCEQLRGKLPFTPYRLALLRSFTVEPAVALLRAEAFVRGLDVNVHLGDFNAYSQEILDPDSALYRFSPDAVILAVQSRDLAPDLWREYADLDPAAVGQAVERVIGGFRNWVTRFRAHTPANLILHSLEKPAFPGLGVLDGQATAGQSAAFEQVNCALRGLAGEFSGVYVLDYDALVARHGRLPWNDEKKWLTMRLPASAGCLGHLAHEWLRFLAPLSGRIAKALVVDLDNTLWGGVIGEDGMAGIRVGTEYPGAVYLALQRVVLDVARRGILLAVCSKNNLEDAMEVLQHHPGMLLRPAHFAARRINWNDKVRNLREIAAELNIGIDALAFLDDNPAERERVRAELPEVMVIELPDDPVRFADTVRDFPAFERLKLSAEDRQRTELYAAQRERSQAAHSFGSKDDFYRFLQQEAEVVPVQPLNLARIAQLTQRTNQFNLTTQRYTEQQISEMSECPGWHVVAVTVRDRYGDHGLVGVAIAHDQRTDCRIETFLLSCRVIGRSIETALLAHVAEQARARGCNRLLGRFLPTKKNAPARNFYEQHGFQLVSQSEQESLWSFDLLQGKIASPDWMKLTVAAKEERDHAI
ncbi:MAG: HAD-IIIC family phosphatase [Candidatus Sulfotelmatobacter sp.]